MKTARLGVSMAMAVLLAGPAVASHTLAAASTSCGVERWPVKTGTDADVGKVDQNATTATSITNLSALPAPSSYPQNNRLGPTETTVFSVSATLVGIKLEDDSDYHLIIQDASGNTMVTEIPAPACVGSSSPFFSAISGARQYFDAHYSATTTLQTVNVPIKVRGVGFFDTEHGVTGAAPNGVELHPVLSVAVGPASAATVDRTAGSSRYDTAAAVSAATFQPGVPVAFVATGDSFPDALAGGPAAAVIGGPVLLVQQNTIPASTAAELQRLTPGRIVVLGGPAAVSDQVVASLGSYTSGGVTREAGSTRYGTAAAISAAAFQSGVSTVLVATGQGFADALSGAAAAGAAKVPILLVASDSVPAETAQELNRLRPGSIVVLGGTSAVSSGVEQQLHAYAGTVARIAGTDRFATSAAIAQAAFPSANRSYLATGLGFADALAGGPAAALSAAPMLLVQSGCVPLGIGNELNVLGPARISVLGGAGAVGTAVESLAPCEAAASHPAPPPSPSPPPGSLSCTASMSNPTPHQYTTDYVNVTTSASAGVTATAHYKTTDTTHTGTADQNGHVSIGFNISGATIGYTVRVDVTVSLSGQTAGCSTSFTPQ